MNTIYLLIDPRTALVRYVGVTSGPLTRRLNDHVRTAAGERTHRGYWINALTTAGYRPLIWPIEVTADRRRECFWIAHYRAAGCLLTNDTEGGDGGSPMLGRHHSAETRARMREAARTSPAAIAAREHITERLQGHTVSQATRQKLSEASRRLWQSAEYRDKNPGVKGKKFSQETKRRMRDAQSHRPRDAGGRWRP